MTTTTPGSTPTTATTAQDEALAIAVEAYIYLYPLVLMEATRRQMTNLPLGEKPSFGPMGAFSHSRTFPDATFRAVVRPNFDTLYSIAWLDLTSEPMVVSVPDTQGRYYLLPLYDMWTDAFAVPGARTSGTGSKHFLIVPPDWSGELPVGLEAIKAPTRLVWVIGRIQTNGPQDYEAVHRIQDGLAITPLSRWGLEPLPVDAVVDPTVDMTTPPMEQVHGMTGHEFFTLAAGLMKMHPPHMTDWSIVARMQRVGLEPGRDLDYEGLDPVARGALDAAPAQARDRIRGSLPHLAPVVDGWQTIGDPMGVYGNSYLHRAQVAMIGLGANPPEDAVYPINVTDSAGNPLDGDHEYVLHFEAAELPPAQAFWSVTMYDAEGYPTANPLDRFALGDRDPLVYNEDGSLDLYLQHESPGTELEANWLPAPRGPLGVTMRLYAPEVEALDGRWSPPAIERR